MTYELLPESERKRVSAVNDKLNVCKKRCRQCLFGKNPHIPWEPAGREKIADIVQKNESGFTCHEYQNSMCHGYWKAHGQHQWFGRLAIHLNAVRWVEK